MARKDGSKSRWRERLELEQTMSPDEAAGYLETIAKGLRDGVVFIEDDAAGHSFPVGGSVEVEVEARQRKRKARIELSLAFRSESGEGAFSEGSPEAPAPETIPDEMSF